MISATIKTYPPISITQFALTFNSTDREAKDNNNSNYFTALAWLHTQLIPLSDAGVAGYSFLTSTKAPSSGYVTAQDFSPEPEALSFGFYGGIINATESDILKLFAPILARLNSTAGTNTSFVPIPGLTLFDVAGTTPGFVGANAQIGSRLWDAAALKNETGLQQTLRAFEKVGLQGLFVSGPGVRNAPHPERVAVNPAWRRTYLHLSKLLDTTFSICLSPRPEQPLTFSFSNRGSLPLPQRHRARRPRELSHAHPDRRPARSRSRHGLLSQRGRRQRARVAAGFFRGQLWALGGDQGEGGSQGAVLVLYLCGERGVEDSGGWAAL